MARYDKEHKQATRARIVESAGSRLKADGIDGAGVAILMKDAGLTNGAFYAHFDSKEHLVAEVIGNEFAVQRSQFESLSPGFTGVEELVHAYLSPAHRDALAQGCPSAALLDEIVRSGDAVREAFTVGALNIVDDIAIRLGGEASGGDVDDQLRASVLSAYALMVGTMQLARALTDRDLSEQLIQQAVGDVLTLLRPLGTEHGSR